jgi:hypothetical protein
VAFNDIQEYGRVGKHILPKTLKGGWPIAQTFVDLKFYAYRVNVPIESTRWHLPAYGPVIRDRAPEPH